MTESSLILTTHSTPNPYPVTAAVASPSLASPLPNGSLSDTNAQDEEEYTIKCICIYADDDGNTVYCPKCDTWQHIDCYYHGKKVPEEHFCAECFPRDLDAKKATERQRRQREALDGGDRKVKRPTSKGQKKKHKDGNTPAEQVNGWHHHERTESFASARDQPPPAKKAKISHRTSGSVASVNGESRKRAASTVQSYPSPSKSPQDLFRYPAIPTYTTEFLELYDRDEGDTHARDNEHTLQALHLLSAWRTNPSLVVSGPGQQPNANSPFVHVNQPLDPSSWPPISVETAQKTEMEYDGKYPRWQFLRVQAPVKKDDVVGEVRGEVGRLEEYCQQRSSPNRWQELQHPDPFVFFHPHMDIYIDSRKSGTQFRYLRRSCRPNVTLKTFVSDDEELHHCFVASKDIPAGSELTAAWFLNPGMFAPSDPNREDSEHFQSRQFDWVSRVLANFGDCACDGGQPCLLARFDRRYPGKTMDGAAKDKVGGRKKKGKTTTKHAISPLSTGQATNSRAGSEALKAQEDDDQFDRRSTSGSSRSGACSRDLTPINVAALDADPVLGSGLTARELRKIQQAEEAFRAQKEKERSKAEGWGKKKKRTSGGSTLSTPNANASKQPGQHASSYPLTPNTQPSQSGPRSTEPFSSGSPPPSKSSSRQKSVDRASRSGTKPDPIATPPREYRSVSIQTDPEESEMASGMPPPKRRKFSTPTQRLLRKVLEERARYEEQQHQVQSSSTSPSPSLAETNSVPGPPINDVEVKDAVAAGGSPDGWSPALIKSAPTATHGTASAGGTVPNYPLPSQAAHTHQPFRPPAAPRLQLSNLPPVPAFPGASMVSQSPPIQTPSLPSASAAGQSPLMVSGPGSGSNSYPGLGSAVVTPGPAKKKLTLGDYMSRLTATPTVEKTQAQAAPLSSDGEPHEAVVGQAEQEEQPEKPSPSSSETQPNSGARPNSVAIEEAIGGREGRPVVDRPIKGGMDDAEHIPPELPPMTARSPPPQATPQTTAIPASDPPRTTVSAQVSQVLAELAQLQPRASTQPASTQR